MGRTLDAWRCVEYGPLVAITSRRAKALRSRITSQGQITVPKAVRDRLGARPGDELEFEPRGDGFMLRHRPRLSVLAFAGLASASAERIPRTAEALDKALEQGRAKEALTQDRRLQDAERAGRRGRRP